MAASRVRSVEGAWSVAPPADFRIAFNGASVTDGTHWTPVDRYTSIAFSNASNSVVISFAAPVSHYARAEPCGWRRRTGKIPGWVVTFAGLRSAGWA